MGILHQLTTGFPQGQILLSGSTAAIGIVNYNDLQANIELSGATNSPLIDAMAGTTTMMLISGNKIGLKSRTLTSDLTVGGSFKFDGSDNAVTGHVSSSADSTSILLDAGMAEGEGGNAEIKFRTNSNNNYGFIIGALNATQDLGQSFILTTGQSLSVTKPTIKIKAGLVGIQHNNPSYALDISGVVQCTGFFIAPLGKGIIGANAPGTLINHQSAESITTFAGDYGETRLFLSGGILADSLLGSTAGIEFCMTESGAANFLITKRGSLTHDGSLIVTTGSDPTVTNPSILIKPADDGKIGINCSSPAALLHVSGSPTAALFRVGTGVLHVENGKVGVNMATAAISRHLDVSGDLGVTGNIYLTGTIYKNGTAYDNPFTATHKYKEGEFLQPGEAVILQGGYVYKASVPYDPTCVGLYFQMNGSDEHSIWGSVTNVAEVAALGDNRIYDSEQNLLLGGFKLTKSKGDIKPGDLVTTSDIPGVLQRQNIREFTSGHWIETSIADCTMRSYTVGKVLEPPIWDLSGFALNVYGYLCTN